MSISNIGHMTEDLGLAPGHKKRGEQGRLDGGQRLFGWGVFTCAGPRHEQDAPDIAFPI